jgi:DNA/RNA endonuclease YhcR with UshA esterase domain
MIVTGKVAQVTSRPSVVFINLDQAGPQSPFTAVIFQDNLSSFGDVQSLQGKNVEISGFITEYHKKPEIVLDSASQIKVVGGK